MKLTNNQNFPAPIVAACQLALDRSEAHEASSDFSVTGLIAPPRLSVLRDEYGMMCEVDVASQIQAVFGTALHKVIEESCEGLTDDDGFAIGDPEIRFETTVEVGDTVYSLSARADWVEPGKIIDWKFTTVWSVKDAMDGGKPDWDAQLNVTRWIAHRAREKACLESGLTAEHADRTTELLVGAFMGDWRRGEAAKDPRMPQSKIEMIPVNMWDEDDVEPWIRARIQLYVDARAGFEAEGQDGLPECSHSEMWGTEQVWAVQKKGGSRAVNGGKHFSQADAEAHIAELLDAEAKVNMKRRNPKPAPEFEIDFRPGRRIRCEDGYCPVSSICHQWERFQADRAAVETAKGSAADEAVRAGSEGR